MDPRQFRINGQQIGAALTPHAFPDPYRAPWTPRGQRKRSHSGRLQSQARASITCEWDFMYASHFKVFRDFWLTLANNGMRVDSITVPAQDGAGNWTTWTTYTADDDRGIFMDEPEGDVGVLDMRSVRCLFWNIKRQES